MGIGGAMTWHTSSTQLSHSCVVVVLWVAGTAVLAGVGMVVVVELAVLAGVGSEVLVVVVEMCCTSATRLRGSGAGAVSVSSFSNEACKSTMAFHMPSGNGSDQVSAQFFSVQGSSASTFSTMFMLSSVGTGDVAVVGLMILYTVIRAV